MEMPVPKVNMLICANFETARQPLSRKWKNNRGSKEEGNALTRVVCE